MLRFLGFQWLLGVVVGSFSRSKAYFAGRLMHGEARVLQDGVNVRRKFTTQPGVHETNG